MMTRSVSEGRPRAPGKRLRVPIVSLVTVVAERVRSTIAAQAPHRSAESAHGRASARAARAPDTGSNTSAGAASAADNGYGSGLKTPGRLALDAAFRSQTDLRLGLAENLSHARTENDPLD